MDLGARKNTPRNEYQGIMSVQEVYKPKVMPSRSPGRGSQSNKCVGTKAGVVDSIKLGWGCK